MHTYRKNLKEPARELRKNQTDAEEHLWHRLRKKKIAGVQFYRQKPIDRFIVDFYCAKAKLVDECDGSQHHTEDGLARDAERDNILSTLGLLVLRFDNRQVLTETDAVCELIRQAVVSRIEES